MQSDQLDEDDGSLVAYRARLRSHYAPPTEQRDIALEAYEAIRAFIEAEFKDSAQFLLDEKGHTIQEVLSFVERAKAQYDTAQHDGNKTRRFLSKFSARVVYYGQVLDVVAQHHPEYVALAWGAMKFVFIGILNHDRLIQEFSQALIRIGDALRQTKLTAELYETDDMMNAISRLYVQILSFLKEALKWYSRSRIGRAISSVFTPYELKCQDIVEEIQACAETINEMAAAKSRAELRDMHISLKIIQREQQQLKLTVDSTFKVATCNKTINERVDINVQDMVPRIRDVQLSQILSALKPHICPHETFQSLQSIVKRSRNLRIPEMEQNDVFQGIKRWFLKDSSSLFVLRVGPRAESKARELTTDIIALLKRKHLKVIWRLSSPHINTEPSALSFTQVLRCLVHQILVVEPSLLHPGDLNAAKFQATHSEEEWISLFRLIFDRLSKCYIIIEMHDLFEAAKENIEWMTKFLKMFQEVSSEATSKGNTLKTLVLCYGGRNEDINEYGDVVVSLRKPTVIPVSRKRTATHRKGVKGWDRVQPKL